VVSIQAAAVAVCVAVQSQVRKVEEWLPELEESEAEIDWQLHSELHSKKLAVGEAETDQL
jgi:hypothetical protein